ncbi:MarP family serine protease [Cryobacterium tepidiphilum]|nr:MarP family serine protease [Cryobacterium tepidiphilum]
MDQPMTPHLILDLLLLLALVGCFVSGYRSGLLRSIAVMLGLVAGGIAAYFVVPLVGSWVPAPEWRTAATLGAAALLVLTGLSIGQSVGFAIRRRTSRSPLRVVDRTLGAVVTTVAAALVLSMVAFTVSALGVPVLSSAIASSKVLQTIDGLTPTPVQRFMAQLRTLTVDEGLPRIIDAFKGPVPEIPKIETGSPALNAAAQSVVRITGNAYACGQNQSGSGFVVAPGRVVTNAHVVAGVTSPVVESPGGQAVRGDIVYFDPVGDLAVIAADDLSASPLDLTKTLGVGATAVTDGYPFGGPFDSDPARVIAVNTQGVADIYGENRAPREVYTIASKVDHGESGGPLLTTDGLVAGVIFAKAANTANVGYALTMDELQPVAAKAPGLNDPVSSGMCVSG